MSWVQPSGEFLELLCSTHAHQLLYNCVCAVHAALQQLCASLGRSIVQVKLTIQGEAYSGVMLQQTVVVDFQACPSTLIVCMHRAVLGQCASFPTGKLQIYKAHRQATHRIHSTVRAGGVEHVHGLQPCQHQRQHVEERCTGAALPFCVTISMCIFGYLEILHCTPRLVLVVCSSVGRHATCRFL